MLSFFFLENVRMDAVEEDSSDPVGNDMWAFLAQNERICGPPSL